jgi:hypothetical protein
MQKMNGLACESANEEFQLGASPDAPLANFGKTHAPRQWHARGFLARAVG